MNIAWSGNAKAVRQVDTVTIAGVWAQNDTITLTINGNDLVVTIGTNVTTSQVATTLKEAIMGTTLTDTAASCSPTVAQGGAQAMGEFAEITATASSAVVTLTANTAGKPFTLTATESTAGTGTASRAGSVTCTGPNYFDNADNWDGGVVPVSTDDVVFNKGNVSLLYNLDQNAITLTSLTITNDYTGNIGLPDYNRDNASKAYREYRETKLKISATTVTIGGGDGPGSRRLRLNFGTAAYTANINHNGTREDQAYPTIQIVGTHANNAVNIVKGDAGFAQASGEVGTVSTLNIEYITDPIADVRVNVGSGSTLKTVVQNGGVLDIYCAITTSLTVQGGVCSVYGTGAVPVLIVRGGECYYNTTGTLGGNPILSGTGRLDFGRDPRAKTVTNPIEVYGQDCILWDPFKAVSSLIVDWNEGSGDLGEQFNLGPNIRLTRGTPA